MNKNEVYNKLNQGLLQERLYAFSRNLTKNNSLIKTFGGLAHVVRSFTDKHVIIIGAGESLEAFLPLLKKIHKRDDVIIIAVDMACAILSAWSITPAFVITCETSCRSFFSDIHFYDTTLLAFSCASNSNLRSWQGKLAFYNWLIREEPYESLWQRAGLDLGFVATGSIVTTQALSIVMALPTRSITLAGNDLALYNYPYCRGASWYNSILPISNRLYTHETISRNSVRSARHYDIKRGERSFSTNNQFLGAKYWIEDLMQASNREVFDLSDPGVSEKYITKLTLKQFEINIIGERKKRRKRR